jgi:hypothetical protein
MQLYRNDGAGKFAVEPLCGGPDRVMRASAYGDIDGDGDLDIVALELDGPVHVLRNTTLLRNTASLKNGPHWLRVQLRSASGNRFALGARVAAQWEGGARATEIRTSGGFQSSVAPEAHFGLGAATKVSKLRIRWPSGRELELSDVAADRALVIDEPEQK